MEDEYYGNYKSCFISTSRLVPLDDMKRIYTAEGDFVKFMVNASEQIFWRSIYTTHYWLEGQRFMYILLLYSFVLCVFYVSTSILRQEDETLINIECKGEIYDTWLSLRTKDHVHVTPFLSSMFYVLSHKL